LGAVRFLRDSLDIREPIVTFAVSMGTAATMLAAAESPEISGLILDSSFLSFDHTITHHVRQWLGIPRFPIADEIILFTRWRVGFNHDDFDMRQAIAKIGDRPVLFIAGGADTRMPPEISRELYQRSTSTRKKLVIVPEARHGAAFRTAPAVYENEIFEFLQTNFGRAVVAAGSP